MIKILIMDDEPALRNIVYNLLKPLGHQLFTSADGRQAIETGAKEIPDVALLDVRVPDMDGLEVLTELRKINPHIKCIMLSGFGDTDAAVDAIKRGAFEYINKPFKIDEVLKIVSKAVDAAGNNPKKTTAVPAVSSSAVLPSSVSHEVSVTPSNIFIKIFRFLRSFRFPL
ncbi:MAG: response regulator [Endomicrobiales bacterium]